MEKIRNSELISFYTHATGFFLTFIGLIPFLIPPYQLINEKISSVIFVLSLGLMFCCSSAYHYTKRNENAESTWRKLDHMAIFIAIAGTYTPYSYLYLNGYLKWLIIIIQWSLAFSGILFKVFFLKAPRLLYTALYLAMGWVVMFPIKHFFKAMPANVFLLLLAGGFFYTSGAVIYAIKKPNPKPGIFGFHEIFHIFIVVAAVLHYMGIFLSVY